MRNLLWDQLDALHHIGKVPKEHFDKSRKSWMLMIGIHLVCGREWWWWWIGEGGDNGFAYRRLPQVEHVVTFLRGG